MPLTEFQQEFLRNCSHRWNIKTGATRSGKTYLDCAVTIPKRICAARDEGLLVMLGNTLGTLERNVLEPMRSLWGPIPQFFDYSLDHMPLLKLAPFQ